MPKSKTSPSSASFRFRVARRIAPSLLLVALGCGPHAHIPVRPGLPGGPTVPGAAVDGDSDATLARALAPRLYIQRDEFFPLSRAVAVIHPSRRVIAYHLLWRDDVAGAWLPFTVPTDEEEVWVGYDSSHVATEMWTYWHGKVLHTRWPGGPPAVNVQWGKHGSLPRGVIESDLPSPRKLNFFWLSTYLLLPDTWLGNINRKGPWCFCHGYKRYREFTRELDLGRQLDAIVRTDNPVPALTAVFGRKYSMKLPWPN
jgi:hypothetical protein